MDWTDIQVIIPVQYLETAEAIAQMAVPYGIYTEDYSDMTEMVQEIAHIDLIDEELLRKDKSIGIVHLYISPEQSPAEAVSYLAHRLKNEGVPHEIKTYGVREEEWATAWKEYYHPTALGERLVVCPSWENYTKQPNELVITLDPGMAFGTGTHHTTRLCAQLLEQVVHSGDRVLDMGTGSGILSIAALLLGAGSAVGVDIDAVAVRTAAENAAANGFTPPAFTALAGDLVSDTALNEKLGGEYDVIAANIVADVIIMLAPSIRRQLRVGGLLVASGIILPRQDEVLSALTANGLTIEKVEEHDGWCAVLAKG
ncbi:MAG: 50S ribosomal protein L11 methyltransferase [Angelakisella sp.]